MSTVLTIAVNHSIADAEYNTSGVDWVDVNLDNDTLIFSAGSDAVADGEVIPGESELNQAGIRINEGNEVIVDKYFLADANANLLKEVFNMGNQNKQYVLAFSFDGATASEPVFEAWDDNNLNTIVTIPLGEGTPGASWIKGKTTTGGAPGVDWVGIALAGASGSNFLELNDGDGALSLAGVLYCNLKIIIPASIIESGAFTPALVCKYTTT